MFSSLQQGFLFRAHFDPDFSPIQHVLLLFHIFQVLPHLVDKDILVMLESLQVNKKGIQFVPIIHINSFVL